MLIWEHASLDYQRMDMELMLLHGLHAFIIHQTGSRA